ncbi:hypothetical protein EVAR_29471_1 [Eumeta japonica]|uniref:WAP domain-containing protein n=1 Tax=Eumeta variegata TaxID=151549 RepID=A0A4C1WWF1_EUMVA|nr:hypothetical protein EVAR_29471_1 [Eumeta japonica]
MGGGDHVLSDCSHARSFLETTVGTYKSKPSFFYSISAAGECPQATKVYGCSPKCVNNYDCSHGKLCCENSCHTKSCVEKAAYGGASNDRGKGQSGGAGVYCNNVKCSPFEVCKQDPATKRMKCSRA